MCSEGPRDLTVTVFRNTQYKEVPHKCFLYREPPTSLTGLSFPLC